MVCLVRVRDYVPLYENTSLILTVRFARFTNDLGQKETNTLLIMWTVFTVVDK